MRIPSVAIRRFWQSYRQLPRDVRKQATAAYRVWQQVAFHPSLHFKKVASDLWSVRVGRSHRGTGIEEFDPASHGIKRLSGDERLRSAAGSEISCEAAAWIWISKVGQWQVSVAAESSTQTLTLTRRESSLHNLWTKPARARCRTAVLRGNR